MDDQGPSLGRRINTRSVIDKVPLIVTHRGERGGPQKLQACGRGGRVLEILLYNNPGPSSKWGIAICQDQDNA